MCFKRKNKQEVLFTIQKDTPLFEKKDKWQDIWIGTKKDGSTVFKIDSEFLSPQDIMQFFCQKANRKISQIIEKLEKLKKDLGDQDISYIVERNYAIGGHFLFGEFEDSIVNINGSEFIWDRRVVLQVEHTPFPPVQNGVLLIKHKKMESYT